MNDIAALRAVYGRYRGDSLGANAVLDLCDEVEQLRAVLRTIRDYYGGAGYVGAMADDAISQDHAPDISAIIKSIDSPPPPESSPVSVRAYYEEVLRRADETTLNRGTDYHAHSWAMKEVMDEIQNLAPFP